MSSKLSRRQLSTYAAGRIADGQNKSEVITEIAAYLQETRRTSEAELIARDIETALLSKGIVVATVVSARPLSDSAKKNTEAFIRTQYSNVTQVTLREEIDESLLAGIRLELPDKQLDQSAKAKLEKLTV